MASYKEIQGINNIIDNYSKMEESLVEQLSFEVSHGPTIGGFREEIWKGLFEQIVPKKFSIERSIFIIDSQGHISNEVDLAIFDEQYTPYIFRYGTLKFIPIEAVAVVIECKSNKQSIKCENIKKWSDSIDKLKTSLNSIVRVAQKVMVTNEKSNNLTQTSTRPIKILCCLNYPAEIKSNFDFIINVNGKSLQIDINKNEDLEYWYLQLNHLTTKDVAKENSKIVQYGQNANLQLNEYEIKNKDNTQNTILTLIFQLNQLLMILNNPIFFPHMSYVNLFNNPNIFEDSSSVVERILKNTLKKFQVSLNNDKKYFEEKYIEVIEMYIESLNITELKENFKTEQFRLVIDKCIQENIITQKIEEKLYQKIYNEFNINLELELNKIFKHE